MDLASVGVALQQASVQQNMSISMMKVAAQGEQAVANMVSTAVSNLGQQLDIHV